MTRKVMQVLLSLPDVFAEIVAELGWDPSEEAPKWRQLGRDPWHLYVEPERNFALGLSAAEPVASAESEPVTPSAAAEAPAEVFFTGIILA